MTTQASSRHFAFLVAEQFPQFSLVAAIDTLRSANRASGSEFYRWSVVTAQGHPVTASNGLPVSPDCAIAELPDADILFVCLGLDLEFDGKARVIAAIRNHVRRGAALGALSAGASLLGEAGLLDGYRCTIHWENRAAFVERFPDVECTNKVFEIDRNRYTCAGGTTTIDLFLEIVRQDLGADTVNEVANQFQHERVRNANDRQRAGPERDLSGKSEKLLVVVRQMADHLDEPLTASGLAATAGLSVRQVERLFLRHLGTTPGRYYMRLRLERARELLRQSNLSILDIAIATGFTSHSYFAQSYRQLFGRPPSEERRTTY